VGHILCATKSVERFQTRKKMKIRRYTCEVVRVIIHLGCQLSQHGRHHHRFIKAFSSPEAVLLLLLLLATSASLASDTDDWLHHQRAAATTSRVRRP